MRFIFAFCIVGTTAAAQGDLNTACSGCSVDRLMLTVVSEKNREMIAALEAIDERSPTKPLAVAMIENLKTITEAVDDSMRKTGNVQAKTCP